jgi:disulfide bond formation protein DsbB
MRESKGLKTKLVYLAGLQAAVATLGSLYFSEVMKFTPCTLCWYQRICMYPLVAILGVGIWKKNRDLPYYVLPLSITGWLISVKHNWGYYHTAGIGQGYCLLGETCNVQYLNWLGFISIPLLSLTAFTVINGCMIVYLKARAKPAEITKG